MSDYVLSVEGYQIDHIATGLTWSSNKDTLGQSLSFAMPFDERNALLPAPFIEPGDKVTLRYKSKIIFFGIVETEERDEREPIKYICFDLAYYLNENEITIQFRNQTISSALEEICRRFGIKCDITKIDVRVTKIYNGKLVSEVIKDLLKIAEQKTGARYRFEMRGDTFVVFHWRDMHVKVNVEWISSPQRKRTMSDMRNKIQVVANGENKMKIFAEAKDERSIKKYGLLTKIEAIDEKEKAKAQQVANNLLKELNRLQETGAVSLLGNYEARAGRLLTLNEPITGLIGDYFITDAQHTLENDIHLMVLGLEVA